MKYLKHLKAANKALCLVLLPTLFWACDSTLISTTSAISGDSQQEDPIARVNDTYLYPSEVSGIVSGNAIGQDSASIMERYVQSWVRKQLMIHQANEQLAIDEAELERKLLDYRYVLLAQEFKKVQVNRLLDKEVTVEDVNTYYEAHPDNFKLKQTIMRGRYVQLPKETPKLRQFRRQWGSNKAADLEDVRSYCYRFASNYVLEDSLWFDVQEVVLNSPWAALTDKGSIMENGAVLEARDDNFRYFLKVEEFKETGEKAPMEFVREQIETLIINRRKGDLVRKLENDIYEQAKQNEEFEIY